MEFRKRTGILAFALLAASATQGQSRGPVLGTVTYGGTGCPAGSAVARILSTGEAEIIFDEFQVQSSNARLERKNCSIAIPVQVPAGYSVSLEGNIEGYQKTLRGGKTIVTSEYFPAGQIGDRVSKSFPAPSSSAFLIRSTLNSTPHWSQCGAGTILRANLSLLSRGRARSLIDHLSLKINVRACR